MGAAASIGAVARVDRSASHFQVSVVAYQRGRMNEQRDAHVPSEARRGKTKWQERECSKAVPAKGLAAVCDWCGERMRHSSQSPLHAFCVAVAAAGRDPMPARCPQCGSPPCSLRVRPAFALDARSRAAGAAKCLGSPLCRLKASRTTGARAGEWERGIEDRAHWRAD